MKRFLAATAAVLGGVVLAPVAFAGDDMTSLSYISYLERYATVRPAHGNDNLDAVVNMPVLAGDRLDTARGSRVEVQLADGSTLWLDEFTTVDFDSVALSRDDGSTRTALYLADGTAAIELTATTAGDGSLRFDSPAGTIFLNRPGVYRLELRGNRIRVQVHSGFAELPAGVGSDILRNGEEATIGDQEGGIERATISDSGDDFWSWVQERRHVPTGRTAQYVGARDSGRAAVLDSYGDWVYVPTFSSWMWQPRVSVGWVPYSYGRWYWTPVGWSWISYEPWGWYPSHYGSWYFDVAFGWVWGFDSVWGPAWVDWFHSPGYVGWCPRGYYDWWYYNNYTHGWGGEGRSPRRWSEASFDFSGRVRLGAIDPRPWTMVPSGQFGSPHIDRVRMDPKRFFEGDPGREGFVRSGPLVTPYPGRAPGDGVVESYFKGGRQTGDVPDLTSIMRREPVTGVRSATTVPRLRVTSTEEITRAATRSTADVTRATSSRDAIGRRWDGRDVSGGAGAGAVTDTRARTDTRRDRTVVERSSNPPVVRREVVRRDDAPARGRDTGQSTGGRSSGGQSTGSSGTGGHTSNPPSVERPQSPPADRPRTSPSERPQSRFSGWSGAQSQAREPVTARVSRGSWAATTTRRDLGTRLYDAPYAARSAYSARAAQPAPTYTRSVPVARAPVTYSRSAPVASGGSHTSASSSRASSSSSSRSTGGHRRP